MNLAASVPTVSDVPLPDLLFGSSEGQWREALGIWHTRKSEFREP